MCQTVEPEEADGMTGTGILYETRQDTTETDIINRWSDHLARCQTQKNQKKPKPKQNKRNKSKNTKETKKNPFSRNFRNKTLLGMFFFGSFDFFGFGFLVLLVSVFTYTSTLKLQPMAPGACRHARRFRCRVPEVCITC